jgi:hypothetical protein
VALLKAGVDFATISQWLGHAGLNTTMRYARADLDLKRQALSQVFPEPLHRLAAVDSCSMEPISLDGCGGCEQVFTERLTADSRGTLGPGNGPDLTEADGRYGP